jgi:hypothetical protein
MDITGAKWRLTSAEAEAVPRLRVMRSSNDFGEYWDYHETCDRLFIRTVKFHPQRFQNLRQSGVILE